MKSSEKLRRRMRRRNIMEDGWYQARKLARDQGVYRIRYKGINYMVSY